MGGRQVLRHFRQDQGILQRGQDPGHPVPVKFEQDIDCGGGYLKLGAFEPESFEGESKYNIMFGPDICGSSTKKTHVIFNYNDKNLDKKSEVSAEKDTLSHLYTLIVKPDNTYEVQIDMEKVADGSLEEGWPFLEPKEIRTLTRRSQRTGWMRR